MTDYAIVVTTHLGQRSAGLAVSEVASATRIPQPTVSKVLKALARAGLVVSFRGARGGYRLAKPPADITIAEIIDAMEGPIAVTECAGESEEIECEHETSCEVRANWQKINDAVKSALSGISLLDMARTDAPNLVPLALSAEHADRLRALRDAEDKTLTAG